MHWIVFMISLNMYNTPGFVLVQQSVCHESFSALINVFLLLAYCLLSTLLAVTLRMRERHHWPSIADMAPQRHSGESFPYLFQFILGLSI